MTRAVTSVAGLVVMATGMATTATDAGDRSGSHIPQWNQLGLDCRAPSFQTCQSVRHDGLLQPRVSLR